VVDLIPVSLINLVELPLCASSSTSYDSRAANEFIWLSDLHFDPTANPKLVDSLAKASVDQWPRILTNTRPDRFSRYGEDTDWPLLASSFDAIRKISGDAQFTIVTGDLLAHQRRAKTALL
jgi:hypothetical protein